MGEHVHKWRRYDDETGRKVWACTCGERSLTDPAVSDDARALLREVRDSRLAWVNLSGSVRERIDAALASP